MSTTEIVLLVIGGLFFAVSFFLPDLKKKEEQKITEEEIKALIDKEVEKARGRIDDMVDETTEYAVEKAERAMEKLSNEKIMAVDEYSETVLKQINDNHNEAVFLYDMLNDKDEKLKNTGEEIKATKTEIEKEKKELEEKKKVEEEADRKISKAIEEIAQNVAAEETKKQELPFVPFIPERLEIVDGVAVPVTKKEEKPKKPAAKKSTASKRTESAPEMVSFESDKGGRKNSNEMIRKLHEQGKTNMQIAKELGLGVGEVKLVIDLFASKKDKN